LRKNTLISETVPLLKLLLRLLVLYVPLVGEARNLASSSTARGQRRGHCRGETMESGEDGGLKHAAMETGHRRVWN
jgi:hypothetical protein